ncbi:junB proto-oncogene, AP-1 transcription factor subunit b [Hippoglossus hippoglossus]|uniref:junB proto-oncogene, AP-1 transcription factor subunit b n=1 Tax=Hippoglossus hippoglossus TaxID=8267 RepID=UPI00148B397A|nr:junB proto-oncogene, AP-1 transcription factor subunit b [Hippoglossus hippoglossus]XP_035037361.1 junB proto-oncogene, AP-1 transcription factor subunit b [Hippoglossus stenolepis]
MSTKMEQPFYHDDSFLSAYGHSEAAMHDYKLLKQNMNLNLTESYRSLKRAEAEHYQGAHQDMGSLKLASPELERLIIQNSNGVITTPTPGQYFYNRGITDEQEGFAEGFVKALDELHQMNEMPPPNVSIGAGGVTCSAAASSVFGSALQPEPPIYTTLNAYCPNTSLSSASSYPTATISYLPPHQHSHLQPSTHGVHHFQHALPGSGLHPQRLVSLKEEPQTVPDLLSSDGSPPMSPIDLDTQERIKAERKRLRNRLAATKCRRRKLERIARLEDKVKGLKNDNAGLSNTASVLRDQVAQLKQKVLTHVSSGCQLMLTSKMEAF